MRDTNVIMNDMMKDLVEKYGVVEKEVITGGNHAGFGNYGVQKGDGTAAIAAEEQQEITAQMVASWTEELGLTMDKS